MTTNYTATQNITTPGTVLTDFTITVPSPSQASLGINAYGAGTGADINTFDIGPCGDSCVILETLAVGGHHIHDGAIHDSRTPAWADPSIGVHGIYDKSNGTLVENIEFYNHPAGEAYSARYGNTCYQSIFHDTPYSVGLFNYQGAALGAAGTLRIRDCVFYNPVAGGYIFYSDGTWKESNGTLLGDSLISVEIDHCTIDIRGMANPFNFHDCHNDVYLTNCVIISDSGLPLSSIIVPPVDGSTVHLDGSIVLNSADAATYLGAAPTFTPIAVGGSPVIGTAVASPPATFTQFGNEGDLGATQTGSSPPGPPPLPGPGLPSLGYFEAGSVDSSGTTTVVIPISTDVPRSSPASATVILIFIQSDPGSFAGVTAAADDATPEDAYSLCIFEDGLNHYRSSGIYPIVGLVVNDLVGGVNNITLTLSTPPTAFHASAIAVTGIGYPVVGPADPTLPTAGGLIQQSEAPTGGGSSTGHGCGWTTNSDSSVTFLNPTSAVDTDWSWVLGAVAFYWVVFNDALSGIDPIGWNWADGAISDFVQWCVPNSFGGFMGTAIGVQDPVTPGAASPSVVGFKQSGDLDEFGGGGNGGAFVPGGGPICTAPSPPGGVPVFNNHIRLSE